jgi:hypothetical protein
MSSSLHVRLRRLASGLGSLGLDGGVAQLLDFALLAVLRARQSPALSPIVRLSPPPRLSTHLPLGEPELAHATALGNDALVLLERAAHDARGDRNVAVVAVTSCQRRGSGRREGSWAYERPAAFHANAIVMVGRVFVGVGFAGCGWGWRCWIEDSREPFGARPSSRARDMAEQLPAYVPTYLHHGRPSAFSGLQPTFKTAIPWSIDWCCIRYIFVAELPHSSLVVLCRAGSAEATGHRSLSLMGLSTSYSSLSIPRLPTSPSPWPRRPPRCRHRGSQMSRPATLRCPGPRGGQTPRQCLQCPRWCCRP